MRNTAFRIIFMAVILMLCVNMVSFPVVHGQQEVDTAILADFDVYDAEIRDVLRSLAELGDINVLIDPVVKGPITIKLKHGMTVKEAIEMITQTYGYAYRWIPSSRTVVIGNEKTFASFETQETRIYQLNYAQADEIAIPLGVVVAKDKIGIDKRTNQITVRASILEQQNIAELIARLDQEMPQINIEARIEEISKTGTEELGLKWSLGTVDPFDSFKFIQAEGVWIGTLSALENKSQARNIASPNISTTDSKEGRIFVGKRYPVITTKATSGGGTETSIEYIDIGTLLVVTPRLNNDQTVTIFLQIKNSSTDMEISSGATTGNLPIVSLREANSVVRLKENETFILSGLNATHEVKSKQNVSGISKIPIIGALFRNKKDTEDDTQLCIFLTPKIIKTTPIKPKVTSTLVASPTPTPKPTPAPIATPVTIKETPATIAPTQSTGAISVVQPVQSPSANVTASNKPVPSVTPAPTTSKVTVVEVKASIIPSPIPTPSTTVSAVSVAMASPSTSSNLMKVNYKVKAGDTQATVAKKFGVTADSIQSENKLKLNEALKTNSILVIPIPEDHVYTLKPKETLWRISKRYNVPLPQLQEINNITDVTKLETGQKIILPVSVAKVADKNY